MAENGDYSVHVTCEATTRKINEIRFEGSHVHVRKTAQERLTVSEQEQRRRVSGGREQTAADEETGDGSSSCLREQGPPVSQEDCHSRFGVSDASHQLASGGFCDWQRL